MLHQTGAPFRHDDAGFQVGVQIEGIQRIEGVEATGRGAPRSVPFPAGALLAEQPVRVDVDQIRPAAEPAVVPGDGERRAAEGPVRRWRAE